jgi:hypothetical protein
MRTIAAGAVLIVGACASQPRDEQALPESADAESADRKPWNAAEMTRLTAELSRAVRDVRAAWRRDPAYRDPSNPNRRAALRLDETLRTLDQRTTQLASRVEGGGGFEQTRSIARNIGVLLNDVDVEARRIGSNQFMEAQVRPAMQLVNEIAPYYGRGPLYDPETMQRLDRPARTR